jgi:hypothetical protein
MAKNSSMVVLLAILLIFAGIININDSVPTTYTQCNDGIDNDGDGEIDYESIDGTIPADTDCSFFQFPNPSISCPNWNNESIAPTSEAECTGGA